MTLDVSQHPCFSASARSTCGRIHLPIAPKCNIQCNYCNRKYDCVNESRPGVTSALLSPHQAVEYLGKVLAREKRITVAGIAGPGDPFAEPERTLETLELIRQRYPQMLLCVATNGLNLAPHLDQLLALNVSHVTVTVNAVTPLIGAAIYAWVRAGRTVRRGLEAAQVLLDRQLEAIRGLKQRGILVKVNTIVIPGVNDHHISSVAQRMADLGVDVLNCMPLYPTYDTVFEQIVQPSNEMIARIRGEAGAFIPQMTHCTRCRADAVGLLGNDRSAEYADCLTACATGPLRPSERRPYVAVASWEGMLVNQHLGEAAHLWIFKQTGSDFACVETRETPSPGTGDLRWMQLADRLKDCRSILASGAGPNPRHILENKGIQVVEMEGVIEEGLEAIYRGGDTRCLRKRQSRGCGDGCTGTGQGCG